MDRATIVTQSRQLLTARMPTELWCCKNKYNGLKYLLHWSRRYSVLSGICQVIFRQYMTKENRNTAGELRFNSNINGGRRHDQFVPSNSFAGRIGDVGNIAITCRVSRLFKYYRWNTGACCCERRQLPVAGAGDVGQQGVVSIHDFDFGCSNTLKEWMKTI